MRFLANENFPADAVSALHDANHDIVWIRTDAPGSSDQEILARAVAESRILLTLDKDFGELAYRSKLPASCGIILFRVSIPSSAHVARVAVRILSSRSDWVGHFAVIEEHRVRMRPLPEAKREL